MSNTITGLRFNTLQQNIEVYDGNHWITLNTESLLDWAREKRTQEIQMEALAESNPTIADLLEQKKNLDHKIKMIQILIKEEPNVGTN